MIELNRKENRNMKFLQMDATAMSFERDTFSVVLDKGTLDALMTDDTAEVQQTVHKYLCEISRVLRYFDHCFFFYKIDVSGFFF